NRGVDSAEITSPVLHRVAIHALGWSKPTSGEVSGAVTVLKIEKPEDVDKYKGKLRGAFILMGKPAEIPNNEADNAYHAVIPPAHGVGNPGASRFRAMFAAFRSLAQESPAAVLLDSGKTDDLFNMGSFSRYQASEVPLAFITHEDYSLIYRLAQSGPVSMKVNLTGTLSSG